MATEPMHVLAAISDDPVGAWRSGDTKVITKLAEIELGRSGLHLPPGYEPVPVSCATTKIRRKGSTVPYGCGRVGLA